MKKLHVRLEYNETIEGKKEILSSQVNVLELLKKIKNYKILRKRELILKNKVKKEIRILSTEINKIQETFPEEETAEGSWEKKEILKEEEKYEKGIELQLEEIKEKLARLNQE